MANKKITDFTELTAPAPADFIEIVDVSDTTDNAAGSSFKVKPSNIITKAHGLSDGVVKVVAGVMTPDTIDFADVDAAAVVTELETIAANDNDTTLPTSAAVKDYVDTAMAAAGAGDMTKAMYDPTSIEADAFARANHTGTQLLATISDVTATATELNILDGVTATAAELNHVDGVTSPIQTQLDAKQATLTGLTATVAELNHTVGVTSAIQTQIDGKQASGATLTSLEGLTLSAGDMLYATGADTLVNLAKGTSLQALRMNAGATAPEWATSASGQTLYDWIVAPSGGTHTTLGAAIASASNGDTIFVRSGTYSESAITSALTDITIIGESNTKSIISMTSNSITLSGADVKLLNLNITSTSGGQFFTGAEFFCHGCQFNTAAGNGNWRVSGTRMQFVNNKVISTASAVSNQIRFHGTKSLISGNRILLSNGSNNANLGAIEIGNDHATFIDNIVESTSGTSGSPILGLGTTTAGISIDFTANKVISTANTQAGVYAASGGVIVNIVGNSFYSVGGKAIRVAQDDSNVTGNIVYTAGNTSADYGIWCEANNCTITGNKLRGPGTTATAGIYVHSAFDNNVVSGNNVYAFASGITVNASTCDNTTITGNNLNGSTVGITDNGTGTNCRSNTWNLGSLINVEKQYFYMKNTSGAALAAGSLVIIKSVAAGDEVTTTTTGGDNKVFGMSIDAPANNAFGRVQTLGKTTVMKVDGTTDIAIGDYISTFTTVGIGQKATAGQTAIAIALEAYTADNSSGVIDALIIPPRVI